MKIKTITLKNFRSYEKETKIDFEDLTVLVGKNDAGKSTILEALDIFFNDNKGTIKLDKEDINVNCKSKDDLETIISVAFTDLPEKIVIDSTVYTSLENEYLLNENNELEIIKKFSNGGNAKVFIRANHPTNSNCSDLLLKKHGDLKKIVKNNGIESENYTTNSILRKAIWNFYKDDLQLDSVEIDASKADAKQIWEKLRIFMPVYTLFQSDRANNDNDSEVQDPLKEAVKVILSDHEIQKTLNEVSNKVQDKLRSVAERTLNKLEEVDEDIATELKPEIPDSDKLKWQDVFKSVSISGDNNIPINKRGSGVKRLILMSFFRGEAERLAEEGGSSGIIYAIEEPETSQHNNNQKILIEAFQNMSKNKGVQVLLTTHSAYMVKQLEFKDIRIIGKDLYSNKNILDIGTARLNYPSLNEVNFLAFDEVNQEYHDELYSFIEFHNLKNEFFKDQQKREYKRITKNNELKIEQKTLSEYIRHQIHHPENIENERFSLKELRTSINLMRDFIKSKNESGELVDPES